MKIEVQTRFSEVLVWYQNLDHPEFKMKYVQENESVSQKLYIMVTFLERNAFSKN